MGQENADPLKWITDRPLAAYLLAGVLGGTGVSGIWTATNNPRPDPFTGTEGRQLDAKIETETGERQAADNLFRYRVQAIERSLEKLTEVVEDHNREAEQWKQRIRQCENGCGK